MWNAKDVKIKHLQETKLSSLQILTTTLMKSREGHSIKEISESSLHMDDVNLNYINK